MVDYATQYRLTLFAAGACAGYAASLGLNLQAAALAIVPTLLVSRLAEPDAVVPW